MFCSVSTGKKLKSVSLVGNSLLSQSHLEIVINSEFCPHRHSNGVQNWKCCQFQYRKYVVLER